MDEDGKVLVWAGDTPTSPASDALQDAPSDIAATPPLLAADAERRQITVMFCDVVDSTKLSQQLDPEDYRAVVRAYQQTAVAQLQPYDGSVAQYLGDGLMVYFGWPTAHEDAARRAVYASLAIVKSTYEWLRPRYQHCLGASQEKYCRHTAYWRSRAYGTSGAVEAFIDERKIKQLLKEALVEVIDERKEVFYELLTEVLEDIVLMRTIQEGEDTEPVSKDEVLKILKDTVRER